MRLFRTTRGLRASLAVTGACLAAAALSAAPAGAADSGLRAITVDGAHATGIIRSLQGVSGSPLPGDGAHPDLTAQEQQLGVSIVRTHDIDCSGTGDLDGAGPNRIFPDPTADPADPASYHFGPTDTALLSIARMGAEIEYSLGRSDLTCAGVAANNGTALAPALYASVARHVAMHYNDGWDHGFHLGIRYWEIWNEPDLTPFWNQPAGDFYALYAATSRALKSLHPWMQIGGPALTTNNDLTGYRESLLAYIRANHLPLDFYPIHHYSDFTEDPYDYVRLAAQYRDLLDSYGLRHTAVQLTEWNYGLVDQPSDAQRAAYTATSLIDMQDTGLQQAFFYRANADGGLGLMSNAGVLSKTGDAFAAAGSLEGTPVRLATIGGDTNGLGVLAGRTPSAHGEIRVLISNYEIPAADYGPFPPFVVDNNFAIPGIGTFTLLPRRNPTYTDNAGYDLTVNHIRGGESGVVVSRYRVDDTHSLSLVDQTVERGPTVHLTAALPAPAVELVVIHPLRGRDR